MGIVLRYSYIQCFLCSSSSSFYFVSFSYHISSHLFPLHTYHILSLSVYFFSLINVRFFYYYLTSMIKDDSCFLSFLSFFLFLPSVLLPLAFPCLGYTLRGRSMYNEILKQKCVCAFPLQTKFN